MGLVTEGNSWKQPQQEAGGEVEFLHFKKFFNFNLLDSYSLTSSHSTLHRPGPSKFVLQMIQFIVNFLLKSGNVLLMLCAELY